MDDGKSGAKNVKQTSASMPIALKERHRQAIEALAQEVQQPASAIAPCYEEILERMTAIATVKDFLPVFVAKRVRERFRQCK